MFSFRFICARRAQVRRGLVRIVAAVATVLLLPLAVLGAGPGATAVGAQPSPWIEPVQAPVVDGYRPPAHIGASGNRGWEYATVPGTPVGAAGDGVVVFAGAIGGAQYVSIQHADGRRTTYSHLATVGVSVGDRVGAGDQVATAGERLHFGVRDGADYQDPGDLFVLPGAAGGASLGSELRLLPVRHVGPARSIVSQAWSRVVSVGLWPRSAWGRAAAALSH